MATVALGGAGLVVHGPTPASAAGTVSDPPQTVTATPGDGSIVVNWAAPASDGGSAITTYTAYAMPTPTIVAGGNGQGSELNQLSLPMDIEVDSTGGVYVTDTYNYRVVYWAPGATAGVVVAGGNGQGYDLDQLAVPLGLARASDGTLNIVDRAASGAAATGDRVVAWPANATSGSVVAGGVGRTYTLDAFNQPKDIVLQPSTASLVVGDGGNQRIVVWPTSATVGTPLTGSGDAYGSTGVSYGLAYNGGKLFQVRAAQVTRWSGSTDDGAIYGTGTAGPSLAQIGSDGDPASGIAFDASNNAFIGDTGSGYGDGNRRIVKWAPSATEATLVYSHDGWGVTNLEIGADGMLYMVDQINHQVLRLDPTAATSCTGTADVGCTISGLTNGTSYDVYVTATNANGTGRAGHAVSAVTPAAAEAPTFSDSTLATATVGAPYTDGVTATGPQGGGAVTYSWKGSTPPGLSLDANTGLITGTPTQGGTYEFTITASNSGGDTDLPVSLVIDDSLPQAGADIIGALSWGLACVGAGLTALAARRRRAA